MSAACEYPAQDPLGRFIRQGHVVVKCGKPATHRCDCCAEASCAAHAGAYFNAKPLPGAAEPITTTLPDTADLGVAPAEGLGSDVRRGGGFRDSRQRAAKRRNR